MATILSNGQTETQKTLVQLSSQKTRFSQRSSLLISIPLVPAVTKIMEVYKQLMVIMNI